MRALGGIAALAAGMSLGAAAQAQEITAGGSIEARAGVGDNPYLQVNSQGASPLVGGSLTGWLQRRTETAETRLTGVASIDQNFDHYGRAENYFAGLSHQQTLSARLSAQGEVSYRDSITPGIVSNDGGSLVDLLAIGQRSRVFNADGLINWQPTSRDSFYAGPTYSHATYPTQRLAGFDQYGLRGGYLRTVNARLKVGIDVYAQKIDSKGNADGTSVQAGLRLVYDFSAIWQFDGTLGAIHQKTDAPFASTSSTIGFTAKVCGKYPRYRICLDAGRQSAPSGYGGLRTDDRIALSGDYDLSSRSRINLQGIYDRSKSNGISIVPAQTYWRVSGGYSRTLTQRLSAGFSGQYQHRNYGNFAGLTDSAVSGYGATADVVYKFGRLE